MSETRPPLSKTLSPEIFRTFYWLKEELMAFCRSHDLPASGSKAALTERVAYFLEYGIAPSETTRAKPSPKKASVDLSLTALIHENYRSDEVHRAFFKSVIGAHFKFTTGFMNFCKENRGKKSYAEAIDYWQKEQEQKRDPQYKTEIAPQFEYNRFIRAYFEHHPDGSLAEAIALWKETKSKSGDNIYRPTKDNKGE